MSFYSTALYNVTLFNSFCLAFRLHTFYSINLCYLTYFVIVISYKVFCFM